MTDSTPTNPGDIVVTGQRVRAASPFADMTFPSKGLENPDQIQTREENPEPGGGTGFVSDEQQQCALPEGRRQWNADARAKEAVSRFQTKASDDFGEDDLANREFGALICEFAPGHIELGPIRAGNPILDAEGNAIPYPPDGPSRPSVAIPREDCGSGIPVGYVHSHPGLNSGIPSDPDFGYAQQLVDYFNAPPSIGVYVVANHQDQQTGAYMTAVSRASLGDRAAANAGTLTPQFVDPAATPCPGDT